MSKIIVANEAQRVILVHEMMGQLSDGYWENTSPYKHWRVWVDAKVEVSRDGQVGRDQGWVRKDNYNFAAKELLEVVGDRIITKVKAALLGFSEEALEVMPDGLADYEWYQGHNSDWSKKKLEKMNSLGINAATIKALEEWQGYTMKDLVKDCKGLKTAFRSVL